MFQRMASSFDESSTAGVFLSVLFSENSRCELLFPSHMTLLQSRPSYSPPPLQGVPASPFMGETISQAQMFCFLSFTLLDRTEAWNTLPNLISVLFLPAGLQRSQEKSSICPSLQDFSFTSWNPEQVRETLQPPNLMLNVIPVIFVHSCLKVLCLWGKKRTLSTCSDMSAWFYKSVWSFCWHKVTRLRWSLLHFSIFRGIL